MSCGIVLAQGRIVTSPPAILLVLAVAGALSAAAEDPTVYFVDVVVRSGSNQPVYLTTVFTVPGAVALAGSNNTALGLEGVGLTQSRLLLGG